MIEPEVYFLKYAFPCMEWKVQRGQITKEEFEKCENAALNNKKLPREFLEKNYPNPIIVMSDISKNIGKKIWDLETVAQYFLIQHNKIIDGKKYGYGIMPSLDELCKVYKAKIVKFVELDKRKMAIVSYHKNQKKRLVDVVLIKDIKIGNLVTIHQNYAVESLSRPSSLAFSYKDKIE